MFFTACVLYSLRLFKLKTEGQTIEPENLNKRYKSETKILSILGYNVA